MNGFKSYVRDAKHNRCWMDKSIVGCVELLSLLQKNGVVHLYKPILDWHVAYKDCQKRVTHGQLVETLRARYNMEATKPFNLQVTLPSSGVPASIPCHDAWAMIQDMLTDPRILPEDYLWFGDDPYGEPPALWQTLRDINDGLAYRQTYAAKILNEPWTPCGRRRVLLPIILYMDSCVTGANENLAIEFVKFTLGIFNSTARDKAYTWRNLGAIPQYHKVRAKAEETLQQSTHMEAHSYLDLSDQEDDETQSRRSTRPIFRKFTGEFECDQYIDSDDEEVDMCNVELPDTEAQDFHVILQVILSSLKKIMRLDGFDWDLYHHASGETRKLFFVPFLLFVKGDTAEHDKLCGRYGPRTRGIKCLCRYCVCPTDESDNPYADFPRKSPEMMCNLIRKGKVDELKLLSQKEVFNAFYEFQFGLHNQLSIHGACPMETLHWIQLGWFKYDRNVFFEHLGPYSILAKELNVLATSKGYLLQRQSYRGFPRTRFTKGIQKGKLHAHEMSGLLLVLLVTIRSSDGRQAILAAKNANFPNEGAISSWILFLELHLMFESWLKLHEIDVGVTIRLRTKIREFMEITRVIGRREKGMGYKTNNFHATKHVPDDILMFGPPHCVNTKSDEMHHKPDKKTAKSTQKRPQSFDYQCASKVDDRRVIETAMLELEGKPKWDYFVGFERDGQHKSDRFIESKQKQFASATGKRARNKPFLTGVKAEFWYDEDKECHVYQVISSMEGKNQYKFTTEVVNAVSDLAFEVSEYVELLSLFSEYVIPNGPTYRCSPYFRKRPWYDWAMCWCGEEIEGFEQHINPVHIRCFVDLTGLPVENNTRYSPGVYMIVEPTRLTPVREELEMSDLLIPFVKDAGQHSANKMDVFSVNRIVGPAAVIPDVGNENGRAYLRVRPVEDWAVLFQNWVNSDHAHPHTESYIGA